MANDVTMFTPQDVDAAVKSVSGQPVVDASRFGEGLDAAPPEPEPAQDRNDLWPTDEEELVVPAEAAPPGDFWADFEPADIEKAKNLEAHATKKYQQIAEKERELAAREAELAQRAQQPSPYYAPQPPPYGYPPPPPPPQEETEPPLPSWAKTDEQVNMMSDEAREAYMGRLEDHYERWEMKRDFQEERQIREQRETLQLAQKLEEDYNKLPADRPPLLQLMQIAEGTFGSLRAKDIVFRAYREFKEPLNVQHLTQAMAPKPSPRIPVPAAPVTSPRPASPSPEPEGGGPQSGKRIAVDAKGVPLPFGTTVARSLRSRGVGVDQDETFGA